MNHASNGKLVGRWQTFLSHTTVPRARYAAGVIWLSTRAAAGEWEGLQAWRLRPVDERRVWGPKNTSKEPPTIVTSSPLDVECLNACSQNRNSPSCLAEWGALVLNTPDPLLKASITHHAFRLWSNHQLPLGVANAPDRPARPEKPLLVPLKQVPDVKNSPLPRNAHVLHILAHIELNAVDLAWDTVVRFSGDSQVLGHQFFCDFAHVADDESRHFGWCVQRLSELGFQYGDMAAHDMLVSEGQKSATNVMARLAVVPMVQELNVELKGPFNHAAREKAGLPRSWYESDIGSSTKVQESTPCSSNSSECVQRIDLEKEVDDAGVNGQGSLKQHSTLKQSSSSSLTEVYKRLELLIAMEKERAA